MLGIGRRFPVEGDCRAITPLSIPMKSPRLLPLLLSAAPACALAAPVITFDSRVLSTEFHSEGAAVGDFNRDGVKDVVSGPNIYFGPDFTKKTVIYESPRFDVRAYSKNFIAYVYDLTGDGWDDVMVLGFPGGGGVLV
jgi:hypothetical protein